MLTFLRVLSWKQVSSSFKMYQSTYQWELRGNLYCIDLKREILTSNTSHQFFIFVKLWKAISQRGSRWTQFWTIVIQGSEWSQFFFIFMSFKTNWSLKWACMQTWCIQGSTNLLHSVTRTCVKTWNYSSFVDVCAYSTS